MGSQSRRRLVLVGAKADDATVEHYGGVLSLSNSLVQQAARIGVDVEIVNTMRPGFDTFSWLRRLKMGLGRAAQLTRLLLRRSATGVIVFSGAGWSFYERTLLSAICRVFRVPCVLSIVDGRFFSVEQGSPLYRRLVGRLLHVPNRLAASGSNWIGLFKRLGVEEDRLVTVRSWIPPTGGSFPVKWLLPGTPLHFLFIGWMVPEKGIHELLAALSDLLPHYDFRFTFLGAGALLEPVRARVAECGWSTSVSAPGWVSPDEMDPYLTSAHVFVLPSYAEGFPMTLIEAMTHGMPAICSNVGAVSDSLRDGVNGRLIPPRDTPALREAMEFYLHHPEAVQTHSAAALSIVRVNHDADANCRRLLDAAMAVV